MATGLAENRAQACARITERAPHERFVPDPAAFGACRQQRRRAHAVWDVLAAPALRALFDAP